MLKAIKRYFIYKNYRKMKQAYINYSDDLQDTYNKANEYQTSFLMQYCPIINKNCIGFGCIFFQGYSINYNATAWDLIKNYVRNYANGDYYCEPYVYQNCKCKLTK